VLIFFGIERKAVDGSLVVDKASGLLWSLLLLLLPLLTVSLFFWSETRGWREELLLLEL
jgi:hypothetical protein